MASASYDWGNELLTFGDKTLEYDYNGNLTSITDASGETIYSWDARNRLTAISAPTPMTAAFTYDGLGRRVSRTVNGITTQYLYDGLDIIQE